jgi:retron-type reverse transcriptase
MEPRAEAKGNASQQRTRRAQDRENVSQALERIRNAARQRKKERFTALYHHLSQETLRTAFFALRREAAPGVDGLTWQDYETDLDRSIENLHARVQRGAYRALPTLRRYIPKPDGRQRPLAITALEDKIVQRATVAVLNAIYEEDFLGFSYGFRPKRGQHDALDALVVGISRTKVNYILDADIRSFFDEVSQEWLLKFLNHRIGDPRMIRLIQKWLKAGVLEEGVVMASERGTGQGSVASPLLPSALTGMNPLSLIKVDPSDAQLFVTGSLVGRTALRRKACLPAFLCSARGPFLRPGLRVEPRRAQRR